MSGSSLSLLLPRHPHKVLSAHPLAVRTSLAPLGTPLALHLVKNWTSFVRQLALKQPRPSS